VLIRTAGGAARLAYLGARGETLELASYDELPWHAGSQRLGRFLARLLTHRRSVIVDEIAWSTELNSAQIDPSTGQSD
jgi:hypothetical protein